MGDAIDPGPGELTHASPATPTPSATESVNAGVVGRAHGIRGEVVVQCRTDEPERRFAAGTALGTGSGRRLIVAGSRWHSGRLLVRFVEVGDRTSAEELRGELLVAQVAADEVPADAEEFYDRQLVGLRVLDSAHAEVGTVVAVVHLPRQDLLEIAVGEQSMPVAERRLVPFVTALVPEVDLRSGTVRLADVPGLLTDAPAEPSDEPR